MVGYSRSKIKIFNSSVMAALLYASESWTVTQRTLDRLQIFINKCLQKIINVHWPDRKYNNEPWKKTGEEPMQELSLIHI